MKTPQQIRDEVAKNHGAVIWNFLLISFKKNGLSLAKLNEITDEAMELYAKQGREEMGVKGSLLSDVDYWKQRCLLAEKCLEESPCDPDITSNQIKAWNAYHKFISWAGNNR